MVSESQDRGHLDYQFRVDEVFWVEEEANLGQLVPQTKKTAFSLGVAVKRKALAEMDYCSLVADRRTIGNFQTRSSYFGKAHSKM
jgi:hypothetical protein